MVSAACLSEYAYVSVMYSTHVNLALCVGACVAAGLKLIDENTQCFDIVFFMFFNLQ